MNRVVKIVVDGTVKDENSTNVSGGFSFALNLPPVNNKATNYQVQVTFEGDDCSSATAYSKVNGMDYAVCTTIQYGYKPSSNSSWLTVEPQATQLMTQTKTPEQMQQKAQNSGWLSVYNEWSWWPPWYRFHVKLAMNGATFDIGLTPILPIPALLTTNIPHNFIPPIPITVSQEEAKKILSDILIETAVEVFGLAGIAVASPLTHLPGSAAIGLAIYGFGLVSLIGLATTLYLSGRTMEAFASLAGFIVNGFGAGIGGLLSLLAHENAATFANAIAFPILGAAMSNMLDPSTLISAIVATTMIAFATFVIESIILHFIPDPLNCYFEPLFITASFVFVATALSLLYTWAGWW
jgi:hypothetical protein